jgi:hypothetical protein
MIESEGITEREGLAGILDFGSPGIRSFDPRKDGARRPAHGDMAVATVKRSNAAASRSAARLPYLFIC